ncbi:MAG: amino acid adenylation domain-containing protein, partial [bacterium]|nr:amino acid adenylation domain-containing protein [bacterium]
TALFKSLEPGAPAKLKFAEFVKWNRARDKREQEVYWKGCLEDWEPRGELPVKNSLPGQGKGDTVEHNVVLAGDLTEDLELCVKKYRVTAASILYTARGLLLQKYVDSPDVLFGTTVSGRNVPGRDFENTVGLFINTLPLRVRGVPGETGMELACRVNEELRQREEFDCTSLVDIKQWVGMEAKGELFDSIVVIENYPLDEVLKKKSGDLSVDSYEMVEKTHYALTLGIILFDGIELRFSCSREFYDDEAVAAMARHFTCLLETLIREPQKKVEDMELVSPGEKQQLLEEFNDTAADFPADKTIGRLFEEQVEKRGDAVAVIGVGTDGLQPVTYYELNKQAGRLARVLREKGVRRYDIVGITVQPSVSMVIGLLGILKSEAAYLSIDPEYPRQRVDYMLKDSSAKFLLRHRSIDARTQGAGDDGAVNGDLHLESDGISVPGGFLLSMVKENLSPEVLPNDNKNRQHPGQLCYLIYTSGTTGKPKAVPIQQKGLVNFTCWRMSAYQYSQRDVTLQLLSYRFDGFAANFYPTLLSGGTLVMMPDTAAAGKMDTAYIMEIIRKTGVTNMALVPGMYEALLESCEQGDLAGLRFVTLAGDKTAPRIVEKSKALIPNTRLANEYGPTEATVTATANLHMEVGNTGNIGKPIGNTKIYILDQSFNMVPVGFNGELCIAGIGVATGYLNNPGLTAEKFREGPAKIYRTGDLARWLPDGSIELAGRSDNQLKIRGYRVEPGEIEARLLEHEIIKEAVVIAAGSDGNQYLCACVVLMPRGESDAASASAGGAENGLHDVKTADTLKHYLAGTLPDYMIPGYFVELEKIPLTVNGKIDRKALALSVGTDCRPGRVYVAPRNTTEQTMAGIWADVLGSGSRDGQKGQAPGIDDNFFEIGGHSLKATILMTRIRKVFGVELPLNTIFDEPTIRSLSARIPTAGEGIYGDIVTAGEREYYPQSSAQKRLFFLEQFENVGTGYNIPGALKVTGTLDMKRLENAFRKLINRHESLRTSFHLVDDMPVQKIHAVDAGGVKEFELEYFPAPQALSGSQRAEACQRSEACPTSEVPETLEAGTPGEPAIMGTDGPAWNFVRPFDLTKAPLMRLGYIDLSGEEGLLLFDMHHIISDGTSMGILTRELGKLYAGQEPPPLKFQYKDYAVWQNTLIAGGQLEEQEAYWLRQFAGDIPGLNLPTDYPRPAVLSYDGARFEFSLSPKEAALFKSLARGGTTLYMLLLAAFNILLYKYAGQEDIIVGSGLMGRRHEDLHGIIGMFVNSMAMRNFPHGEKSFNQFLGEVRRTTIQGFENQDVQFEDIVDKLGMERDPSRNPLFDVLFVVQNFEYSEVQLEGAVLTPYRYENITSKFDITLYADEVGDHIRFQLEYCTKLFREETMRRLAGHLVNTIHAVSAAPGTLIKDIHILSEGEKEQLLIDFNCTASDYPKDKTICELFREQVQKTPHQNAVVMNNLAVTYSELQQRAEIIAAYLVHEHGLRVGEGVGLLLDRSITMMEAILGILIAGGAYVPLDPAFPMERLRQLMDDAAVGVVVSEKRYIKTLNLLQWDCPAFHTFLCMDSF